MNHSIVIELMQCKECAYFGVYEKNTICKLNGYDIKPNSYCKYHSHGCVDKGQYRQLPKIKERVNEYSAYRRRTNINFLLKCRLRLSLFTALDRYSNGKTQSSTKYGINWDACCKKLMETKPSDFEERKYQIDHIKPLSSFDLTDTEQVRKAFSPENLQWLTAEENNKKGNKTWLL